MVHEVTDAPCASTEMPLQARPHRAPAKPRPVGDRNVGISHAQHALLNEIENFLVERRLQSIRRVPRNAFVKPYRLLAHRRVERHRALDRRFRRFGAANDLDQRNDVRRIERMPDDAALWMLAIRLHYIHRDAGRARREYRIDRCNLVHLGVELRLEVGSFRRVLLHEIRFGEGHAHRRREREPVAGRTVRESVLGERHPRLVDVLAERGFRIRRGIGCDHVEPA